MNAVVSRTQEAYIYALCDPRDGRVRYVGKTADVADRVRSHMQAGQLAKTTRRTSWLKSLARHGLMPEVAVLESIPEDGDVDEAERRWIALYRAAGADLVNGTAGGTGGDTMTPEQRAAWRERMAGRVRSEEEKAKRSASQKARLAAPEMRAKWREVALRGGNTPPPAGRGEVNCNARFTDDQVREIRERVARGEVQKDVAAAFGTSGAYVHQVVTGVIRADAGGPIRVKSVAGETRAAS